MIKWSITRKIIVVPCDTNTDKTIYSLMWFQSWIKCFLFVISSSNWGRGNNNQPNQEELGIFSSLQTFHSFHPHKKWKWNRFLLFFFRWWSFRWSIRYVHERFRYYLHDRWPQRVQTLTVTVDNNNKQSQKKKGKNVKERHFIAEWFARFFTRCYRDDRNYYFAMSTCLRNVYIRYVFWLLTCSYIFENE